MPIVLFRHSANTSVNVIKHAANSCIFLFNLKNRDFYNFLDYLCSENIPTRTSNMTKSLL